MELQLKRFIKIATVLLCLVSCSDKQEIEGNWSAMDSLGNYSELYLKDNKVRICTEIAGYLGTRSTKIKEDSLTINHSNYHINWINHDSLILQSKFSTMYLSRIPDGFKLSDITNESLEDIYLEGFYSRMFVRKGIEPKIHDVPDSVPGIKEEIIDIKRR